MADYNVTINNSVNTFGPAPSNLWNAYNWNSFLWGEGTSDLAVYVNLIVNTSSFSLDSAITQYWGFYISISDASLVPTSSVDIYFATGITISETLSPTADMYAETLGDGSGYNYVFGVSTNAENRPPSTYTEASDPSTTWVAASAATTTWS